MKTPEYDAKNKGRLFELLSRDLKNELSMQEEFELEQMIQENPEARRMYFQIAQGSAATEDTMLRRLPV